MTRSGHPPVDDSSEAAATAGHREGPADGFARRRVAAAQAGERADQLVAHLFGMSRAGARRLFAQGRVWVRATAPAREAARRAAKGERLAEGMEIHVALGERDDESEAWGARADPEAATRLVVLLETVEMVVIDKPAGQPCAPLAPDELGTVANGLVWRFPEMAGVGHRPLEPGLCHRLDNGTSGVVLAARTTVAFERLFAAIRAGDVRKSYLLVCPAAPLPDEGVIDVPLAPRRGDRRRVTAHEGAAPATRGKPREARTEFRVLERVGDSALVEAWAPRAVRHQIRAHFALLGAPLHGDALYGSRVSLEEGRHALHAHRIEWPGDAAVAGFSACSHLPSALARLLG